MGISDRLLGKKNVNGNPRIEAVHPSAALPGGEVRISGTGLRPPELRRPRVRFGELEGAVLISSDEFLVARVPASASSGPVVVSTNGHSSNLFTPSPIPPLMPKATSTRPSPVRGDKKCRSRFTRSTPTTVQNPSSEI